MDLSRLVNHIIDGALCARRRHSRFAGEPACDHGRYERTSVELTHRRANQHTVSYTSSAVSDSIDSYHD